MATKISSRELLEAIKSGLTDAQLREKFQLNQKQLEKAFGKLVENGGLSQADLDQRKSDDDFLEFSTPITPDTGGSSRTTPDSAGAPRRRPDFVPPTGPEGTPPSMPPDLDKYKRNAMIGIIGGIMLQIMGLVALSLTSTGLPGPEILIALLILSLTGSAVQIFGYYCLGKFKGYRWPVALLGLIGWIGLVIILVLPNKYEEERRARGLAPY